MANKYLNTDLATGSNDGTSWANAWQTYAAAIAAAVEGDIVWVHATTYTAGASITFNPVEGTAWIGSNDTSNAPPQTLGTPIVDCGSGNFVFDVSGGRWVGFSFKAGTSANGLSAVGQNNARVTTMENCTFDTVRDSAQSRLRIGSAVQSRLRTIGCTWLLANAGAYIRVYGFWDSVRDTFCPSGPVATELVNFNDIGSAKFIGCDFSTFTSGKTLFNANGSFVYEIWLVGCKLGASVALFGTLGNESGGHLYVSDCSSGDNHYVFEHHSARGNTTMEVGKYLTSDAAKYDGTTPYCWKITTTAGVGPLNPYHSPWIDVYKVAATFTPYLEMLRVDSTTALTKSEIYSEWLHKSDSGFPTLGTLTSTRQGLAAWATPHTDVPTGTGTSNWTGAGGTAWSGKLSAGSLTTAELGYMRVRVVVGKASQTVYVDPKIRT